MMRKFFGRILSWLNRILVGGLTTSLPYFPVRKIRYCEETKIQLRTGERMLAFSTFSRFIRVDGN